jgi:hypothetical protein
MAGLERIMLGLNSSMHQWLSFVDDAKVAEWQQTAEWRNQEQPE